MESEAVAFISVNAKPSLDRSMQNPDSLSELSLQARFSCAVASQINALSVAAAANARMSFRVLTISPETDAVTIFCNICIVGI